MKYYLKINNTEYKNVSALQIGQKYRAESVKQNLAGGYLIDRFGGEKLSITVQINMISELELMDLQEAFELISCDVEFDRGSIRETRTMRILPFTEPSPLYYYGDKNKGIVYGSIRLTMEEM